MKSLILAASILAVFSGHALAQDEDPQQPTANTGADVTLRTPKQIGCYTNPGDMWDMGPYTYQSQGWCQPLCVRQGALYFGLVNGTTCFCGNDTPSSNDKLDDEECNVSCNGYDKKNCGGTNKWMVYANQYRVGDMTGTVKITTPSQTWFGHDATSTSTPSTTKKAKQTSDGDKAAQEQSTIVVTISGKPVQTVATASPKAESSGGGSNKAGIAAGVVVGVVALAAIIGGVIFFLRRKKQKALEDERRRHEAMTSFVTRGEKPPSTFSASDSRLEPSVMFQRRQSDGSIADNQDYSRRILKVTNPDDR